MIQLLRKCIEAWKASSWMPEPRDIFGLLADLYIYGHSCERVYLDEHGEMKYQRVDIYKGAQD